MKYLVNYNAQNMAVYKSVKACLNLINRKGWKNDAENGLYIFDEEGNEYDTITGELIEDIFEVDELTPREFDTLVDILNDYPNSYVDLTRSTSDVVYLQIPETNGFFICLQSDFDKACDYITNPAQIEW